MPMNFIEAVKIFERRAEDTIENAEGIKLGLQIIREQHQYIQLLLSELKKHDIEPPQPSE